MSATQELKNLIIQARFGEHNDAKMYEPVSTDIWFLLNATTSYTQVGMSNDGFIDYGGLEPKYYYYIIRLKTLNEDGSQTNINNWGNEKCKEILGLIKK